MIKIPININSSKIQNAINNHVNYVESINKVQELITRSTGEEKKFYSYLEDNMKRIIKALPSELEDIIKDVEKNYWIGSPKINKLFKNAIKEKYKKSNGISKEEFISEVKQKLLDNLISLCDYTDKSEHLLKDIIDKVKNIDIKSIHKVGQLRDEIKSVEKDFNNTNIEIHKNIKSIFNYDKFINEEDNAIWNSYKLLGEINIRVCPYCNRQYISIYNSSNGKTRPELDHFYPRWIYPYLGLSFFNLIPSCHICNSNLKGSIDTYGVNLNPYEFGFEDQLKFSINLATTQNDIDIINKKPTGKQLKDDEVNYTDFLLGNDDGFDIDIVGETTTYIGVRGKKNIEDFKLKELYRNHRDIIQQIIKKSIAYNEERIDELFREYEGTLFNSKEEVVQMIMSSFIDKENFSKRTLSKFIRDISEELGLIK